MLRYRVNLAALLSTGVLVPGTEQNLSTEGFTCMITAEKSHHHNRVEKRD